MRPILVFLFAVALSCGISNAIGLGVSPPSLELEEGLGRLTLFNPGDKPIRFGIELEGEMAARPSDGTIAPKRSASVIITGEGNGVARVLADGAGNTGGMAMPAISIPIKELDWVPADETSILIPALIGATCAVVIVITSIGVILVRKQHNHPQQTKTPDNAENLVIHEESLSSN